MSNPFVPTSMSLASLALTSKVPADFSLYALCALLGASPCVFLPSGEEAAPLESSVTGSSSVEATGNAVGEPSRTLSSSGHVAGEFSLLCDPSIAFSPPSRSSLYSGSGGETADASNTVRSDSMIVFLKASEASTRLLLALRSTPAALVPLAAASAYPALTSSAGGDFTGDTADVVESLPCEPGSHIPLLPDLDALGATEDRGGPPLWLADLVATRAADFPSACLSAPVARPSTGAISGEEAPVLVTAGRERDVSGKVRTVLG
mmetsp:Transcript_30018/g.92033  ORF Transcript_30018/g.92033 Transcript_30018/m.92033 type:complete len:263 (+) Transcript_30018:345-1133(+)